MGEVIAICCLLLVWQFIVAPALFGGGVEYVDDFMAGMAVTPVLVAAGALTWAIAWSCGVLFG